MKNKHNGNSTKVSINKDNWRDKIIMLKEKYPYLSSRELNSTRDNSGDMHDDIHTRIGTSN
jgi:hypothetical protein